MVSFGFPFSFPQPPNPKPPFSRHLYVAAAAAAFSVGAGIAISQNSSSNNDPFLMMHNRRRSSSPAVWGSLSLAEKDQSPVTESRTGTSFPAVVKEKQRLLGVGLRRKAVLGLKNIDVYAFGVYADDSDVKKVLGEKYGSLSASDMKTKEQLKEDLMESDVSMTIRLQIVYGRLSIRSVRSAFEESVGSRLQKFGGGSDNKELLQRFTSQFKDEYKIPKGSIIDLSRDRGYVLHTMIDGKEVGSIESKLLCRSILDLYIGNEPFDRKAKEDVELNLASLLRK